MPDAAAGALLHCSDDRPDDRCAARVLMRNLSRSLSDNLARPWLSSSLLAADPDRCSLLIRRRASIRSSTVACRSRARSKNRERLRDEFEVDVSPVSVASAPKGGASETSSPACSPSSCSGRRSRRLESLISYVPCMIQPTQGQLTKVGRYQTHLPAKGQHTAGEICDCKARHGHPLRL